MATKRKLSPSNEDYLEKILELSQRGEAVRSVDIASHLHVSKAGVYKAVGVLREAGLIAQAHYGQIYLTEQGRQRAMEMEQSLEAYVQEKPIQALLMAAGAGLLLGMLWKRG